MRKWLRAALCLLPWVWVTAVAQTQTVDGIQLKVGFVNIRKLMEQAPQLQQIQDNLESLFAEENRAIIALRNDIARLSAQYNAKADKATVKALQNQIDSKQREMAKRQKQLRDAYSLRRNEALGELQTLIVNMVASVSKEKHLDIVLNNTGVIYVNNRIDITPAVFKKLSEQQID